MKEHWQERTRSKEIMIVKLKRKNVDYADLSPRQPYFVIGIEADDYRILNDMGRPYLYPAELFELSTTVNRTTGLQNTAKTASVIPTRHS